MALLHDGFTINCVSWLEDLGFCGLGEAKDFVGDGSCIALDGELPLNPHGGQLSGGRTHGFGFIHEAVLQLRHAAGELADRGLDHGGRLAIGLRNSPELVCAALAAWKLGPPRSPSGGTCRPGSWSGSSMGHLVADGYLCVVDRRVDLIITGGANVFPAEVEAALIDHPKVADVVVIGLRDPEWGRRVHANVEPATPDDPPTLDEVRAYAKSRLAAYKIPKSVEIVDTMPRSAATKVNRDGWSRSAAADGRTPELPC